MNPKQLLGLTVVSMFLATLLGASVVSAQDGTRIRFGVLPVLQALPLFVAQERGLFSKAGVNVELIPFSTAAEKDIALSSGSIDGCFADLVTPLVLKGNRRDIIIAATNYDTRQDRRMFAVLGKPKGPYRSVKDLARVPVAISSNSVIDYVTERLLVSGGVPLEQVASIESKNIGLRLQMLLSGQVEAATLPEPLVSVALAKGAVLLADDSGLSTSQTVLVFSRPFLADHGSLIKAFHEALNEAASLIKDAPDTIRSVMVTHVMLPENLRATYPVPRFPRLQAPDKEAVLTIAHWLRQRGVIRPQLTYEEVADARYVP